MLGNNPLIYLIFLLLWLVDLVIGVWYVLVLSKSVAEAHGYSLWRGFSFLAIGTLLLFLPFLLLALIFRVVLVIKKEDSCGFILVGGRKALVDDLVPYSSNDSVRLG